MEFAFCLMNGRIISVKIGLFFQEITFIREFPGSNFFAMMMLLNMPQKKMFLCNYVQNGISFEEKVYVK